MFRLMPVRLWRRISMALALLSVGAALVGSLSRIVAMSFCEPRS